MCTGPEPHPGRSEEVEWDHVERPIQFFGFVTGKGRWVVLGKTTPPRLSAQTVDADKSATKADPADGGVQYEVTRTPG